MTTTLKAEQERVLRQMADVLRLLLSGDEAMVQAVHVDIRRIYTDMAPAHAALLAAHAEALERERWIPVEERLPERLQRVLAYLPAEGEAELCIYQAHTGGWYSLEGQNYIVSADVSHWQPKPAPPVGCPPPPAQAPASAEGGAE